MESDEKCGIIAPKSVDPGQQPAASITSLPRELLIMIIRLSLHADQYPYDLFNLMLVCHHWGDLIADEKRLWVYVYPQRWKSIPMLLERSGNALLLVTWCVPDGYHNIVKGAWENIFTSHFDRIGELLYEETQPWAPMLDPRSLPKTSPVLQHLDCKGFEPPRKAANPAALMIISLQSAPCLSVLKLGGLHLGDLTGYDFPRLEELQVDTSWWDPGLKALLDFFYRTPHLWLIKIHLRERSTIRALHDPTPYHMEEHRRIRLEQLDELDCSSWIPTSAVFLLASHLDAPSLRDVSYKILPENGRRHEISPDKLFSQLLPTHSSFKQMQPTSLFIYQYGYDGSLNVSDQSFSFQAEDEDWPDQGHGPLSWLDISVINQRTLQDQQMIRRQSRQLTLLLRNVCSLACLTLLRIDIEVDTATWIELCRSSKTLATVQIWIYAWPSFLSIFLTTARRKKSFLRSLSTLKFDTSCENRRLIPGDNWLSAADSEQLNEALELRLASRIPRLQNLDVEVEGAPDPCNPETLFSPSDWKEASVHFRRHRELVETLTIRPFIAADSGPDSK